VEEEESRSVGQKGAELPTAAISVELKLMTTSIRMAWVLIDVLESNAK